jgi:hypothetical protein
MALAFRISQHHYNGGNTATSVQELMTPSNIRANVTVFATDIADVHAKGLKYIFGEANSGNEKSEIS